MRLMRPFFKLYGGKWRSVPRLYPHPQHDIIIEPFAGAAGYAVRYHDRRVTLADVDPVITGIWKYLIRVSSAEILSLPDLGPYDTVDDLKVCQEAKWLIGFWLNSATSSPRKSPSAWMRSGIRPGCFWGTRVRQTIASQVDGIRHWTILEGGYETLPNVSATWFIDPPYQHAGRHYTFGSTLLDYVHLGAWCRARNGQIIVCESAGAAWLPFTPLASIKTARRRRSQEAIWIYNNT